MSDDDRTFIASQIDTNESCIIGGSRPINFIVARICCEFI